mmetsp:Transcript_45464/g.89996  ORF Transcript_45464/g.89996 Transcript_45464/m.89996 type:complete len:135 (+) Transcript_45464:99-503(+)
MADMPTWMAARAEVIATQPHGGLFRAGNGKHCTDDGMMIDEVIMAMVIDGSGGYSIGIMGSSRDPLAVITQLETIAAVSIVPHGMDVSGFNLDEHTLSCYRACTDVLPHIFCRNSACGIFWCAFHLRGRLYFGD